MVLKGCCLRYEIINKFQVFKIPSNYATDSAWKTSVLLFLGVLDEKDVSNTCDFFVISKFIKKIPPKHEKKYLLQSPKLPFLEREVVSKDPSFVKPLRC